ncbi:MAG TPA: cyclic nucleotide-binding domain-containing protein [Firmicutes bacterium]|nr:cyclic nucleotide-binding domain-containing protein [Bacillota bacterium]
MKASEQEGVWLYRVLKKIDFFSECSLGEIESLISNLIKKNYKKGQRVFNQGDDADYLYILFQGNVGIFVKSGIGKKKIASLDSGNYFGEMSLVLGDKKSATAVCETPCDFFLLFKNDFNDFVYRNPSIKEKINRIIEKRNAEKNLELKSEKSGKGLLKKLFGFNK